MAFGSGDQREVITLIVDNDGAIRALKETGEQVGELRLGVDQAGQGFSKFQATITTVSSAISAAGVVFNAVSGTTKALFQALEDSKPIIDASNAFDRLSQAAGVSAEVFAQDLRNATGGAITDFELFKAANEALLAGLKPDQFKAIAEAADLYADATGVSGVQALQKFTDGTIRGNVAIVQQIKELVTLAEVTDKNNTEQISAAAAYELLVVELTNFGNEILKAIGGSVTFGEIISEVAGAVRNLKNVIEPASEALGTFIGVASNLFNRDAFEKELAANEAIETLRHVVSNATDEFIKSDEALKVFAQKLAIVEDSADDLGSILGGRLRNQANELADKLKELRSQLGVVDAQQTTNNKTSQTAAKLINAVTEAIEQQRKKQQEYKKELSGSNKEQESFISATRRLNSELDTLLDLSAKGLITGERLGIEFARITKEAEKLDVVLGEISDKPIIDVRVAPVGNLLEELLKGSSGNIDAAITNAFAKIADSAEDAAAQVLRFGFRALLGEKISKKELQNFIVDLGSQVGESFLGSIGGAIGEGFTALIVDFFKDKDTPGTTARKAADKFFAEVFDANRLGVIIDGELVKIRDLVFKGDTIFGGTSDFSRNFARFFEGLPAASRQAFAGVGVAFEELLGVSGDIAGQIGAVLANNIGGSLNNLQLLVQATGKNFEDLRGAVIEAFLDQKLSALEAQSALNGLAQIAQKGIPDALGATAQAFANLVAAGVKGGRTLVDALGDLGAEAAEVNLRTFDDLARNLLDSGATTTDQVTLLFNALRANGITSIEQLRDATAEQLLPVLSQLQAEGFQFSEVSRDAEDLVAELNNIPDEINTTINVDVRVRDPANALPVVTGGRFGTATGFYNVGIGRF